MAACQRLAWWQRAPSPPAAVLAGLMADPRVHAAVDGRIWTYSLPGSENVHMPRPALVLKPGGVGGGLGPGARSYVPWLVTRFDVYAYGKDVLEQDNLAWLVNRTLQDWQRQVHKGLIIHAAIYTGGPHTLRDAATDWPFVLMSYDIHTVTAALD